MKFYIIFILLLLIALFIYQNLVFTYDVLEFENGTRINFIEKNKALVQRKNKSEIVVPVDGIKQIILGDLILHKTPMGLVLLENNKKYRLK